MTGGVPEGAPPVRVCCCVVLLRGPTGVPGAVGPGRPRDRHTRASLGVVDLEVRPGPPDPPAPSTPVGPGVLTCGWASAHCLARPCHRPRALRPGPPDPPAPSTPVGPGVLMVGLARCLEARLQLLIINFARNSFTAHSNIECVSLELQRFWGVSKSDRDKLRAKCGWRWCRRRPRVPQSGPVG